MIVANRSIPAALAVALAVLPASGCGWVAGMARGNPEWRHLERQPEQLGLVARRVVFRSRDGLRVASWWIPATVRARDAAQLPDGDDACRTVVRGGGGRASIVVAHGVGGNRADMLPHAKFLADAGYNVLAIDLRAHGETESDYPSPGFLEAAEVEAAAEEAHRHSPCPVVLLGYSMGAVAVLHAASHHAPATAVIADSAFISSFDMFDHLRASMAAAGESVWARMGVWFLGQRWLAGVFAWMLEEGGGPHIDTRDGELVPVLPQVAVPVLFVTGTSDLLAPTANTHVMARLVRNARVVELAATHNTYPERPREYEHAVLDFLAGALAHSESAALK
jgi:pimeloyl-ACP methyl ester carboxylesterase